MPYETIVFMQGDDADEPLGILYNREPDDTTLTDLRTAFIRAHGLTGDPSVALRVLELEHGNEPLPLPSIVYHGPTAESVAATLAYLSQWDYGEPAEQTDTPSSGSSDDTWEEDGYRLSASLSYGYISLERVITLPVESYRCPCCGDDVMDTPPVCRHCREAECIQTVDAGGELGYHGCERTDTGDTDGLTDQAAKLGHDAGIAAASWVFDGSTPDDTYRRVLAGIETGDPEVMDAYREPSLSGEFADDYSESDLARDLDIEPYSELSAEMCDAWSEAASSAFWCEIGRIARHHRAA